jgi:hypothetical protein
MLTKHDLQRVPISHPTYHHFVGNGQFDSDLDLLLYTNTPGCAESLSQIFCKLEHPLVDSAHDLILSKFSLAPAPTTLASSAANITAPRVTNDRVKVVWTEEGEAAYLREVGPGLARLRAACPDPSSPSAMSALLVSTYSLFRSSATATNKSISLGAVRTPRPARSPAIEQLQRTVLAASRALTRLTSSSAPSPAALTAAREALTAARAALRRGTRAQQREEAVSRDPRLNAVLGSDPTSVYKAIKSANSATSRKIPSIRVRDRTYVGDNVPDGFYDSLQKLKCPDMSGISSTPEFQSTLADYENIIKICQSGDPIPPISLSESEDILLSVRANVNDLFSVTANHFINAGAEGLQHFHFLLSFVLSTVSLASIDELNSAWACILYKGHQKDRESDRSYRNISTCPFLAKCADVHVGRMFGPGWAAAQAATQYQGEGSSHDLAALLLSETINCSIFINKNPIYVLLLDALSAFDNVVRQCAIRSAFLAGSRGQGLLYLDTRLASRRTFAEYDKVLMGPISDSLGLEQGGVNSDRLYKLCNNYQLSTAQLSELGVDTGAAVVSCIGQADDTALVSDCIYRLAGLVYLAEQYCQAFHVTLVPEKTKLLAFSPSGQESVVRLAKLVNPISIAGNKIDFCSSAEHVGILRTTEGGNMPHILGRIAAHRRAVAGVAHCGLARGHRGNPVAGLRLEKLYGAPRLLSGVAALVLSAPELGALHAHYKSSIRQLLRLPANTPEPFIMLMAGRCP